jgi:hypothetical protein
MFSMGHLSHLTETDGGALAGYGPISDPALWISGVTLLVALEWKQNLNSTTRRLKGNRL